jgi:hypothetical protein
MNLTTLLCTLTDQRCQTMHKIDVDFVQFQQDGCIITIKDILKHTRAGKHQPPLCLAAYPQDKWLCIVQHLLEYLKRTLNICKDQTQLLIGLNKPHHAVNKDTIGRWVKTTLKIGIDTEEFPSHSTRAASTTCAKSARIEFTTNYVSCRVVKFVDVCKLEDCSAIHTRILFDSFVPDWWLIEFQSIFNLK